MPEHEGGADPVRPVLVFDSGVGGLSVAREIRRLTPERPLVYLADDAGFPYGAWEGDALARHCVYLVRDAVSGHDPAAVVVACNTASTLILPPLRAVLAIPVVGTVPAIKPAAARSRSGLVTVLATPATVTRDYTFDLIHRFAPETAITLVGAGGLAALAEDKLAGRPVDRDRLAAEIAPCFCERDGTRTDVVVLACTHFPLLRAELEAVAPWPVDWLDPAPAIARRLCEVLGVDPGARTGGTARGAVTALATSGRELAVVRAVLGAVALS